MNRLRNDNQLVEVEYERISPAARRPRISLLPRSDKSTLEEAQMQYVHDQCLALLAKARLEHTAALSIMELLFTSAAPQSAAEFHEIVRAYAQSVTKKIRGW